MKSIYKIGTDNFYVVGEDRLIDNVDLVPNGYTENIPVTNYSDGTSKGFFKAKWAGSAWVEGATEEEINSFING